MSLKITSIVRNGPAGCGHFNVTANDNGTVTTKQLTLPQIAALFSGFPGGNRGALLLAWAQDRLDRGATPAQLVNVEIESVIS
jgi:hypothetical protein